MKVTGKMIKHMGKVCIDIMMDLLMLANGLRMCSMDTEYRN